MAEMFFKEGILANDDILTYEEFKEYITPRIKILFADGKILIHNIISSIKSNDIRQAVIDWESFEKTILQNQSVSLVAIGNLSAEDASYQWYQASQESDLLTKAGRFSKSNNLDYKIKSTLYNLRIQQILSNHLAELIRDVSVKTIYYGNPEGNMILNFFLQNAPNQLVKSHIGKMMHAQQPQPYAVVLYGDITKGLGWRGNVADAFINHLGHYHINLLKTLFITQNSNTENIEQSVFTEEGWNINKILIDSTNNTPWYTGGDLILKYNGLTLNVQLKTMQAYQENKMQINSKISTDAFFKFLIELEQMLSFTTQDEQIIKFLFDNLKTSGFVQQSVKHVDQYINKFTSTSIKFAKS